MADKAPSQRELSPKVTEGVLSNKTMEVRYYETWSAFLVSGLVLGIIGATASVTAIALSAVGMAKVRRASKN